MAFLTRVLLLLAVVPSAGADNWERFRGPNAAGIADDKNIPITFNTTEHVLWKYVLTGIGNSSPIVWGDRLFLHASSKDGTSRSLICLRVADGKLLWEQSVPGIHVQIRADSSFASSTPTTDGQHVYVSFWDGKDILLTAFDFKGEKRWSKNLGDFNSQHGPGASPILVGDKLILANDMDKDDFTTKKPNERPSFLMCFNKRTGELLWETPRTAERACYSAPFVRQRTGRLPELIVTNTKSVSAYNLDSGSLLWEAKNWQDGGAKSPLRTVATPALLGDVLCVTSGGDAGRFAVGLELPNGTSTAPKQLWDNRKDFPYVASPLAHGDHFYFVNDAGFAGCYEARTGKRIWQERISEAGFHSSPLLIDGKVYAVSSAGDVFVFPAATTFRLLARNEMGETIRATPAVAAGRLYLRGDKHLYCIARTSN
jgi:outer membrane protein assembly factor BamB